MADQILRNKDGMAIGYIRPLGANIYLYNARGVRQGYYNPTNNSTYTAQGALVARSNILATLLKN